MPFILGTTTAVLVTLAMMTGMGFLIAHLYKEYFDTVEEEFDDER